MSVHALVTATTFRYANAIVRIIRIIDLNQPFVIAGTKLSEPEGESPLLAHDGITLKDLCQASRVSLQNWLANGGSCERCALEIPMGAVGGCGPLPWTVLARFVALVAGFVLMFWADRPGTTRGGFSNEHNFSALLMTIFIETRIGKQVRRAPFPRLGGERKLVKVRLANG